MNLLEKTLEYIFLPTCGVCGKLGEGYLCEKCGKELNKYASYTTKNVRNIKMTVEIEENNNLNGTATKLVISSNIKKLHIFQYKELIRKLIIQYKFNNKSYLYKTFCEFIVKNKKAFDFIKSYDIIIPVPMHNKKRALRGYNQSELIAKELAKKAKIIIFTDILIKTKNNKVQSSLNKEDRKNNVEGVYKLVNKEKIYNKNILIFDDIYTTGATVNECIKELHKANVQSIGILTLAKD